MSKWQVEDEAWKAIMADPQLAGARRKLSIHEIRLIVDHARAHNPPPASCPRSTSPLRFCADCDGSFPCQHPDVAKPSDATLRMAETLGARWVPRDGGE